ncbi:MAG: hypothetical protein KatS3mg121_0992 [Gammaproteobacteria bacterium]|nr:MAG: hypothetical protein KatS3mg121_0992 [Gammaproteobacteria bacterium]
MRIIGGRWRGRRLAVAAVPGLRPTKDSVRETVFNWLAGRLAGARCLDAFAGSGALGIEAASRGAAEVWLVERARPACAALRRNLAALGDPPQLRLVCAPVERLLAGTPPQPFDLVFLDPPFASGAGERLLPLLDARLARAGRPVVPGVAGDRGAAGAAGGLGLASAQGPGRRRLRPGRGGSARRRSGLA